VKNNKTIGFDRKIELSWLDATAYWTSQGLGERGVADKLSELLGGRLSDQSERSGLSKTITVLLHIWNKVPERLTPFRDEALSLYQKASNREQLAFHWGMSCATYQFFAKVVEAAGLLLRLQSTIAISQVRRRMKEQYGDRSIVTYATRRVVRSIENWGLLKEGAGQGEYNVMDQIHLTDEVSLWLTEAILLGNGSKVVPFDQLPSLPALFPFHVNISFENMSRNPRLELLRQALDETVVVVKT